MTPTLRAAVDLDALDFEKSGGTVTVVTQDATTGAILMVAHADRAALEATIATGEMHYRSRTRGLWRKGATSGHTQRVVSMAGDCDGDAVLARVVPAGPACHTGARSCFGDVALDSDALSALEHVISRRASTPNDGASYTQRLLGNRNTRLKKIGEESAELIAALADEDSTQAVAEAADLIYHVLVALHAAGASLTDVRATIAARAG